MRARISIITESGAQQPSTQHDALNYLSSDITKKLQDIATQEIDDPNTIIQTAVTGVTPQKGLPQGGTAVMIVGANFENLDKQKGVTFGGVAATRADAKNDATICATIPAHAGSANAVDVVVNASGGAGTKIGGFTYVSQTTTVGSITYQSPSLNSITVNPSVVTKGVPLLGGAITITASKNSPDFSDVKGVMIGGQMLQPSVNKNVTPNTLTVVPPTNIAPGPADVVVIMNDQTKNITGSGMFAFDDPKACQKQAESKKQIIAYVDNALGKKVDAALFETRELINLIEDVLKRPWDENTRKNLNQALQATKSVQDLLLTLELNPPIDAIGHQVQFIILYNASITPTWSLVKFKGPSPAMGSLASQTNTLTHTLNIAMGPPGSADVANTLGALQIGTAVGNQLGISGLTITP